jgi:NADH:ubiquinone oxidoreductase subunit 6 (subunit J)
MGLQTILFIVFGIVALGAAVAAVVLRNAFHSALALAGSCLGVAGVLVSLGAPVLAGVQALLFAGGIAALIRFGPASLREMTGPGSLGHSRWWWAGATVAVALCTVLGWAAFSHDWGLEPESGLIPAGSIQALGTALIDPAGFVLPLASAVIVLLVALVGAARLVRRR